MERSAPGKTPSALRRASRVRREYKGAAHEAKPETKAISTSSRSSTRSTRIRSNDIAKSWRRWSEATSHAASSAVEQPLPHGRVTSCSNSSTTRKHCTDRFSTSSKLRRKTRRDRPPRSGQQASIMPPAIFARSIRCKTPIRATMRHRRSLKNRSSSCKPIASRMGLAALALDQQ